MYAGKTWTAAAVAHLVGGATGGAALGAGAWLLALPSRSLMHEWQPEFVLLLVSIAFVHDHVWRFPIPQRKVQVNPMALVHHPVAGALVYGLSLGAGVLTYIPFASFLVFLVAIAMRPAPDVILLGIAYGAGRALFPFAVAALMPRPTQTANVVGLLARLRPVASGASLVAAAIVGMSP